MLKEYIKRDKKVFLRVTEEKEINLAALKKKVEIKEKELEDLKIFIKEVEGK